MGPSAKDVHGDTAVATLFGYYSPLTWFT